MIDLASQQIKKTKFGANSYNLTSVSVIQNIINKHNILQSLYLKPKICFCLLEETW